MRRSEDEWIWNGQCLGRQAAVALPEDDSAAFAAVGALDSKIVLASVAPAFLRCHEKMTILCESAVELDRWLTRAVGDDFPDADKLLTGHALEFRLIDVTLLDQRIRYATLGRHPLPRRLADLAADYHPSATETLEVLKTNPQAIVRALGRAEPIRDVYRVQRCIARSLEQDAMRYVGNL